MQALRQGRLTLLAASAVTVVCFFTQGCGWERTMAFPSPSRAAAVEIWQTRFDNSWKARVELVTARARTVLYTQQREALIYFVHVYWLRGETVVGVFAAGGPMAADVRTGESVPFERIRNEFVRSLRETYRIAPGED